MSERPDETRPNDPTPDRPRPDEGPTSANLDRTPAEGSLTGGEETKALAATAAGAGCLATGFLPVLFVGLGAVALLLTLGLFRSGCNAQSDPTDGRVPGSVESR